MLDIKYIREHPDMEKNSKKRIVTIVITILISIAIEVTIFVVWAGKGFGCGIDMFGFYNWNHRNDLCSIFQYSGLLLLVFPLSFFLPIKKDKYLTIISVSAFIAMLYVLLAIIT